MPDVGEDNIDQYHRILRRKVRSVPLTLTRQSRKHKPRVRYILTTNHCCMASLPILPYIAGWSSTHPLFSLQCNMTYVLKINNLPKPKPNKQRICGTVRTPNNSATDFCNTQASCHESPNSSLKHSQFPFTYPYGLLLCLTGQCSD